MSVVVRNLGGDPDGVCEYEVRINERRICVLKHSRPDGLATLLRLAADAVSAAEMSKVIDLLDNGDGNFA